MIPGLVPDLELAIRSLLGVTSERVAIDEPLLARLLRQPSQHPDFSTFVRALAFICQPDSAPYRLGLKSGRERRPTLLESAVRAALPDDHIFEKLDPILIRDALFLALEQDEFPPLLNAIADAFERRSPKQRLVIQRCRGRNQTRGEGFATMERQLEIARYVEGITPFFNSQQEAAVEQAVKKYGVNRDTVFEALKLWRTIDAEIDEAKGAIFAFLARPSA